MFTTTLLITTTFTLIISIGVIVFGTRKINKIIKEELLGE